MKARLDKLLSREFILAFIIEAVASAGFLMKLIDFTSWFAVSGMVLGLYQGMKTKPAPTD